MHARLADQTRGLLDHQVIQQVGELLGAFVLRRLKADVLTRLPPKLEVEVCVPMSFTQVPLCSVQHRVCSTTSFSPLDAATFAGLLHVHFSNRRLTQYRRA